MVWFVKCQVVSVQSICIVLLHDNIIIVLCLLLLSLISSNNCSSFFLVSIKINQTYFFKQSILHNFKQNFVCVCLYDFAAIKIKLLFENGKIHILSHLFVRSKSEWIENCVGNSLLNSWRNVGHSWSTIVEDPHMHTHARTRPHHWVWFESAKLLVEATAAKVLRQRKQNEMRRQWVFALNF